MGKVSEKTVEISKAVFQSLQKSGLNDSDLGDLIALAQSSFLDDGDIQWGASVTKYVKQCKEAFYNGIREACFEDGIYREALKAEAPHLLESFLYYMEINRTPEKKFYIPRERTLNVVVNDLQELEDRKIVFLGVSLPPRTGKSTLCMFFIAWHVGRCISSHNAMSGHSGILADHFYSEIFKLTESEEYTFHEIFPNADHPKTAADKKELSYDKNESFPTLVCRGIDGTWTGAVDISADGYLYVDDMVRDRTESLSPVRLENRYQDYLNVLVDRKNDGSRELVVGTRWNILDILGRTEKLYAGNPLYRFRKIPALNEKGESNFIYDYGKGFSTEYYQDLKARLDKNEWEAKYQQRPFVREGLLFPVDELKRFNGFLPAGGFVQVVTACDVSWGGGDNLSMPIGYQYEDGSVFIVDWVFVSAAKEYTVPRVCAEIIKHKIQRVNFEANVGGDMYAFYVEEKLKENKYMCSITSTRAPNTMSKLAKIQQYSQDIKEKFYFLTEDKASREYQNAVDEVTMFVQIGKNEHDDACDSLAQLESFIEGGWSAKAEIMNRPY